MYLKTLIFWEELLTFCNMCYENKTHRGIVCIKAAMPRNSNIVSYEKYYLPSLFEGRLVWVLFRKGT